ncbi:MAG: hypothetical protein AB7V45_08520 [Candidatus Krumholzibacteriia bacterium]
MILLQMRSQKVWDNLGRVLVVSSLASLLAVNTLTFLMWSRKDSGPLDPVVLSLPVIFVLTGVGGLLYGGALNRTSTWWAGLPVPARRVWLAHAVALALAGLLVVLFQGLATGLFAWLLAVMIGKPVLSASSIAGMVFAAGSVTVLAAAVLASVRPSRADLGGVGGWPGIRAVVFIGAGALVYAAARIPVWTAGVTLGAAALLVAGTHRRLDPALVFDSDRTKAGAGPVNGTAVLASSPGFRMPGPWAPIGVLDQLFKMRYRWTLPIQLLTVLFGAMMSGAVMSDQGPALDVARTTSGILMVYLLLAFSGEFIQRLHRIDSLPVSRTRLLAALVLPGILAVSLGYGGGVAYLRLRGTPVEGVGFQHRYAVFGPTVPPGYSRVVKKHSSEPLTAPWGETHPVQALHGIPLPRDPWAARPPFMVTVPEDGPVPSPEYLAWQIAEAGELVYGVRIPEQEIVERYLRTDKEGRPGVVEGGLTLARDFGLEVRSTGPVFPLLVGPVFLGYFICLALYFRFFRTLRTKRQGRVLFWVMMGGLMVLHMMRVFGTWPLPNSYAAAVMVFRPAMRLQAMGVAGTVLSYGALLLLMVLAWRWTVRELMKVQAPIK